MRYKLIAFLIFALMVIVSSCSAMAEVWTVTAYCPCAHCCGFTGGITASGKPVRVGYAAVNWLPFGTPLYIDGVGRVIVEDRGSNSWFGTPSNPKRRVDIYMPTHDAAVRFGVKKLKVERIAPILANTDCSILVW